MSDFLRSTFGHSINYWREIFRAKAQGIIDIRQFGYPQDIKFDGILGLDWFTRRVQKL